MAATNYTPIQLYHSTTTTAVPVNTNLVDGELAINITDGKLFYKDNSGTVQVIATKATGTIGGSTTQVQYNNAGVLAGSANFTFNGTTATINTLNLTNALGAAYGGTAQSSYTAGDIIYATGATALAKLGIGLSTYILTSTGAAPQWSAPTAISVSTATNLAGGAAGSVPYQSGAGATTFLSIGTANQVLTSSGTAPQWSSGLSITTLTASDAVTFSAITQNIALGTSQTSGTFTVGGAAQTGNITLDQSTKAHTLNIGTGATESAATKTINFGTAGVSGSTTTIAIGSAAGATGLTVNAVSTITPVARTSGAASYFTLTTPADTNQTASTEVIGASFTAADRQWLVGALALQRERVFAAPTYKFTGASTLTTAINVDIATPAAGTNATITNAYALRAGASLFTGTLTMDSTNAIDTTNLEVTNIKAKDGTAAIVLTDSTGAVTISTALTANGGAVFNENGANVDFRVEGDNEANLLFVDASADFVGIGTNAPGARLELRGPDNTAINSKGNLFVSDGGTATQSAGEGGQISLGAWLNGDLTNPYAMGVIKGITESSTTNVNGGALLFGTAQSSTVVVERARITSTGTLNIVGAGTAGSTQAISFNGSTPVDTLVTTSGGNVGIGTNAPAGVVGTGKTLALYNTTHATISVQVVDGTNDRNATLELLSSGNGGSTADFVFGDTDTTPATPSPLRFLGRHNGTTTERARITSGGDFRVKGAGTAGSTDAFQVSGSAPADAARLDSSGNLLVGTTSATAGAVFKVTGATANSISHQVWTTASSTDAAYWTEGSGSVNGVATGSNAAAAMIKVNKDSGTTRSINAAGSLNASGADYAEYMTKAGNFKIAKGDICGIDENGKLTNVFAKAISFVVKSTDPAYVGGDTWFVEAVPSDEAELPAFKERMESARQMVDRIAFAGQVPVNVIGATAGQYIVPVNDNGAIKGIAINSPTFEQYQIALGKVIAIESDGRARIIVKVV